MNENDYIEELKKRWPRRGKATIEAITLADEATRAFPHSPKLWCMRGNLIEHGPENSSRSLDDALASYKRAVEVDPQFIQAWENIGDFYHDVLDEKDKAKPYFHEAERLKGYHDPVLARAILRREFDAQKGSFLIQIRCKLEWDWDAFRRLTGAMYEVADAAKGQPSIETWIAQGFWYCDTFIRAWTSHPNFPRPPEEAYQDALLLLDNLASFLFTGQSPYMGDTLRKKAKG